MLSKTVSCVGRRTRGLGRVLVVGVTLGWAAAGTAHAAPPEDPARTEARALGSLGVQAYAAKDFETASAKLNAAFQLVKVPTLGLWSARALVKLGRWVEAEERYRAVGELALSPSDAPIQQTAKEEAASELSELLRDMPHVVLGVSGAVDDRVKVTLDGVLVPLDDVGRERMINPGRHVYAVERGSVHRQLSFDMRKGEHQELWLTLEPEPVPRTVAKVPSAPDAAVWQKDETDRTLRTAGWVALGASGVGLMTGSIAYFVGKNHYTSLERRSLCVNADCPQSEVDAYNTWRAVHITGLVAGGLLGAAGLTLVIATGAASSEPEPHANVSLQIEPGHLSLSGRF